jgi:lipoprotein Spr
MNKILIPISFFNVKYDSSQHPQGIRYGGLEKGANCQYFAYMVLKYFGYKIGNFRSSNLWDDKIYTKQVETLKPLDILLFNRSKKSYGAHIGLYLGNDRILHLCKEVGYPTIWSFAEFEKRHRYSVFIGAKRPKIRRKNF